MITELLVVAVLFLVYFFPLIMAILKKKKNSDAIGVLNLLLGWTFIGWVVALVWACTVDK